MQNSLTVKSYRSDWSSHLPLYVTFDLMASRNISFQCLLSLLWNPTETYVHTGCCTKSNFSQRWVKQKERYGMKSHRKRSRTSIVIITQLQYFTSGISSNGWFTASSNRARDRPVSPRIVSSSAYCRKTDNSSFKFRPSLLSILSWLIKRIADVHRIQKTGTEDIHRMCMPTARTKLPNPIDAIETTSYLHPCGTVSGIEFQELFVQFSTAVKLAKLLK